MKDVVMMLKAIHASEDREAPLDKSETVIKKSVLKFSKLSIMIGNVIH